MKILLKDFNKCKTVYMRLRPNPRQQLLVPEKTLSAPNPNCYVCAADPAIHLRVDTKRMRIKELRDEVLKKTLNMINPEVLIDSKGVVVISWEEAETECNEEKFLNELDIVDGVILKCDDFFQNYELNIIIIHTDAEHECPLFEVVADKDQLKPKEKIVKKIKKGNIVDGPSTSKQARLNQMIEFSDDDDLCIVEEEDESVKGRTKDAWVQTSKIEMATKGTNTLCVTFSSPDEPMPAIERKTTVVDIINNDVIEILDSDEETGPTNTKRIRVAEPTSNHGSENIINID
uniref:Ubiquitin/SUMO-activating enzyme ubiquitin-like domain-containing protein n=1 Tax=Glossina austeni TaxID=7395 RepID=A0A1A9V4S5_GLOAU